MTTSPAFQFYPSDFLSDENVILMSNQAVGCYIKLLCVCWKEGSIPSDLSKLTKLCNETPENMAELWPSLEPCFKQNSHGRMTNPRLEREWLKQQGFRNERARSGKKGADARWLNVKNKRIAIEKTDSSELTDAVLDGSAMILPMANDGSSSSSSSLIKKEIKKKEVVIIPEWLDPDLWKEFLKHRRKLRKVMTEYAQELMFKKLEWLKEKGYKPEHLLKDAIVKGYQDVFEPKE